MAINASAELSVLQAVAQFLTYAVMAVFAENAVFFRALGVSRLNKLVNDPKISTWQYCIPIILVQTISAPMGWAAQSLTLPALAKVLPGWLPVNALRPLVFLNCSLIAMGIVWLLFILASACKAAKETLSPLLGQAPDPELVQEIRDIVMAHSTVQGIHDLVVHDYGPGRCMISLNAEVPAHGDIMEMHDVIDNIEK